MNAWEENRLMTSGVVRLKEVGPGGVGQGGEAGVGGECVPGS